MTPATIILEAQSDGIILTLSLAGTIKVAGDGTAVNLWMPLLRKHKPAIVEALQQAEADTKAILAWLARIGETDQAMIDHVLEQYRIDPEAREYYSGRAAEKE